MSKPRHNWTRAEIQALYRQPLLELVYEAQTVHRQHFRTGEVQKSSLLSIKTGGCQEDCSYCPQSSRHHTEVAAEPLMPLEDVLTAARQAKDGGATRFCMGAAWRSIPEGPDFEQVLSMVQEVSALGLEVCCTLGMLDEAQAQALADAGLTAYNHNLDTSPEYYNEIITTRTYQDRLDTLQHIRNAGIKVCCGGIIGLGESTEDRIGLLHALATQEPHPESVPINMLVPVEGTPLGDQFMRGAQRPSEQSERDGEALLASPVEGATLAPIIDVIEWIRVIATARIIMPHSMVRLSAGRSVLSDEAQALAFMAGANSIFSGRKLLTTPNPEADVDGRLFAKLGLIEMPQAADK